MTKPPFIDLLDALNSFAGKNKGSSPHEIARQFVLKEGEARGGVEVMVITDKQGKFVAAGTSNLPDMVNFPPAVINRLDDPQAGFVMHHNHPAMEEPYFSKTDVQGLKDHRGIGWLLMHREDSYSAIRVTDKMFKPDALGLVPAAGIHAAYDTALSIAQFTMSQKGLELHPGFKENNAAELALQAMQQVGAIQHYSSIKTGLGQEREREIIGIVRREAERNLTRSGGDGIWFAAKTSAPEGRPGDHRDIALPNPSTLEVGFDRFLAILARQDAVPSRAATARAQPAELPKADPPATVESVRPAGIPVRGSGLKTPRS